MADSDWDKMLTKEEVLEAVTQDLGTDSYRLVSYSLQPASENPMGFLGIHVKIKAVVEINNETKNIQYFAKKIPVDIPSHNAYAKETGAFYKEVRFYKAVVRNILDNLKPDRKVKKWCPEFYFARESEIFVVEDLSLKGYYMYPERTLLDLDHVMVTMRTMAVMHAGSLILEEKLAKGLARKKPDGWSEGQPVTQDQLYPDIMFETEACGETGHIGNIFYEAGIKSQLAIVDLLPDFTSEQKQNIKKKLPDILRRMFELVKPSTKYRNTWIHGDLWSNNIMFRKGPDGKVNDAVLIDFQLARVAPPAHDLIMFIHLVQTREFRDRYLPLIREQFYATFAEEFTAEGLDPNSVLTFAEFVESCDYYYEYSLLTKVLYYQLILSPTSITSKFLASPDLFVKNMLEDRTEMVTETYKTDELCRKRITESMMELIEFHKMAD